MQHARTVYSYKCVLCGDGKGKTHHMAHIPEVVQCALSYVGLLLLLLLIVLAPQGSSGKSKAKI